MIFITGDTHGDFTRFENDRFSNLTKKDYVIICGDFGGVWENNKRSRYERKNLKKLSKMKFTTLFVDGNHENFNRLYKYPVRKWNGGKVHKISKSIYHLMRGEIYHIEGKKIFVFGGASSHDIDDGILNISETDKIEEYTRRGAMFRIRDYTWWDLELPLESELTNGINNLKKNNNEVDYIITHCAPTSIQNVFNKYYRVDRLTTYLDNIREEVKFKKWYFGHYHKNDSTTFSNFECLYENIVELK